MLSQSCLKRSDVSTLFSTFKTRVDITPNNEAFRYYDSHSTSWRTINWLDAYKHMIDVRNALLTENIQTGDRILLAMSNSPAWVYIEQAALYMGFVIVALPPALTASNICQIAEETDSKIAFIESDNLWHAISSNPFVRGSGMSVVCHQKQKEIKSALYFTQWLQTKSKQYLTPSVSNDISEDSLATIIYTSGSCEKPKGVKHSHKNLINNAYACLERIDVNDQDKMLSVTPISHCLERVAGYYVAMIAGASIVFPKTLETILEDLSESKATILVTTPHHLTKAYKRLLNNLTVSTKLVDQYLAHLEGVGKWRLKFIFWPIIRAIVEKKAKKLLLHQLRMIICGGSALPTNIASLSYFLNLPVLQGYGLTEAGGVVSANAITSNLPHSVGKALCNTELRISKNHELLVKNDSLMLGYWDDKQPTKKTDDWLHTEDLVRLENDYLFIEGRKNRTIHLSTGEAIFPLPIEQKLLQDALFENVMIFGENREKIFLLCQLNKDEWQAFRKKYAKNNETNINVFTERLKSILLIHTNLILRSIPGHPHIPLICPTLTPWSLDNGLLNAQGKINKGAVEQFFNNEISELV